MNNDNHLVYALLGDGELQEGQTGKLLCMLLQKKVDNLIATIDLNGKQIDGTTDEVLAMGSVKKRSLKHLIGLY